MTINKFKLNDNFFISLGTMLAEYATVGSGTMELVDERGKTITQISPDKHLEGSDLWGVDLSGLDLSYADLRNANLRNANLSNANLHNANLSYAYLNEANLRKAYLSEADLSNANLNEADLREANLHNANLSYADLNEADLRDAQICSANIYGAKLIGAVLGALPSVLQIPRGKLIGFKKVVGASGRHLIAKLLIKGGTPRSKATTNKMRAKSVVVLGFYELNGERSKETIAYSLHDLTFPYAIGKINCDNWNSDRWKECAGGIHFFLTWRDTVEYQF